MKPTISVLIDTFNHERYIGAALESVFAQEGLRQGMVEVVVIDDGSTDNTREIVCRFGNNVRYYHKPNGGQASAFNFGIPLCSGEIICFLDGDDWWHPKKLSSVLNEFQQYPSVIGVGHAIIEVDEIAHIRAKVGPSERTQITLDSPSAIYAFHNFGCCLGTSRLAMKRWVAEEMLNVPRELVFEADEYLFTLLPTFGRVHVLPEPLTYYRIHGGNLYQDSSSLPLKYELDERLNRRASIYACLASVLPAELLKRGCDPSLIELVLGPIQVQASRLKLMTAGGTRLENFKSERRAATVFVRHESAYTSAVLYVSLCLALFLSPKLYFRVRQAYSNFLQNAQRK
jgi:hypothetical protein